MYLTLTHKTFGRFTTAQTLEVQEIGSIQSKKGEEG